MKAAALAFLALVALQAQAQTYKCVDDKKRITYANTACDKQGLKDAGPVPERLMTMPHAEVRKGVPGNDPAKAPARRDAGDPDAGRGGAQVKPAAPLPEKLVK